MLSRVDFPHPDGPISATIECGSISRSTLRDGAHFLAALAERLADALKLNHPRWRSGQNSMRW